LIYLTGFTGHLIILRGNAGQGNPVAFGSGGTIFGVQVPVLQELMVVHTCPHAPQFEGSAFTLRHLPPQQTEFGDWQVFPQVPQFSGSDRVFTHPAPQ
jgi:hypothetical protein